MYTILIVVKNKLLFVTQNLKLNHSNYFAVIFLPDFLICFYHLGIITGNIICS